LLHRPQHKNRILHFGKVKLKSKYLDKSELGKLRAMLAEEAWLPFWVSLETGLRIGDVVKLRRQNLQSDGLHYKAQKTGKNGVAAISADLRRNLSARRGKWLFPSPYKKDKHITRQTAWARIKAACKRAGIDDEGVSPHSLRKVFAVELYREKGFKAVQEALQHNSAATTEIYSFADWNTGDNAEKPLQRKDLQLIVQMVIEALGESRAFVKENRGKRTKKGS
jgi:integrase